MQKWPLPLIEVCKTLALNVEEVGYVVRYDQRATILCPRKLTVVTGHMSEGDESLV